LYRWSWEFRRFCKKRERRTLLRSFSLLIRWRGRFLEEFWRHLELRRLTARLLPLLHPKRVFWDADFVLVVASLILLHSMMV
jgi:hypothetical protein